jgi:hypothetical protein
MIEISDKPDTFPLRPLKLASYCQTLVSQRHTTRDDTINEDRVSLLVLQALYLNGVLKCEYIVDGFLEGRISNMSEFR